jgi:uncharacterized protein YndB with AHSA1/START domain
MNLELRFQEFYPHPIEAVWAALTDPAALAVWLMANDFAPRVGRHFTFRDAPTPEWRGWIDCEVLTLEPPSRMVWSWRSSDDGPLTQVEILLRTVGGGTELKLAHTGETDPARSSRYASGWPGKLAALRNLLLQSQSKLT